MMSKLGLKDNEPFMLAPLDVKGVCLCLCVCIFKRVKFRHLIQNVGREIEITYFILFF